MRKGYKIVAITPAGRRNCLEILYSYIAKNKHILDRWDLWVNTQNEEDLEYIKELAEREEIINLIYPTWPYERDYPNLSLAPFWSGAIEEDTIYIRFDDDVVFIEDQTIENLIGFRIENRNHLFVYPFIINNPFHSKNLQSRGIVDHQHGAIRTNKEFSLFGLGDPVSFYSSRFARDLHESFIESYYKKEHFKFMCDEKIIWETGETVYEYGTNKTKEYLSDGGPQVSINCICWFGEDMKKITPINNCYFEGDAIQSELTDEEAYLTIVKTRDLNMPSCTAPNTLIVHFLFGPQRKQDEMLDILEKYKRISNA
jgi:hypothetical protein